MRKALLGQPIEIFGEGLQLRDPVYVNDIVEAFLLAGATPTLRSPDFHERNKLRGTGEETGTQRLRSSGGRGAPLSPPVWAVAVLSPALAGGYLRAVAAVMVAVGNFSLNRSPAN